jgi:glucose/arabinose dehydrogenase
VGILLCACAFSYRESRGGGVASAPDERISSSDPRFSIEVVAQFADSVIVEELGAFPICVTVDENDSVFVSLHMRSQEDYAGKIIQILDSPPDQAKPMLKRVAESPCLFHTFGLAARGGHLFVARSGFLARATKGHIDYENAGAITRLSDLDRDGTMDYYEDVVVGLPGSQGPIPQHSLNGIAFGADGSLYIAQGAHSDRDPISQTWEGKILRATPDFQTVSVFASGFRNPFGLTLGPNHQLFATDSDVVIGDPGDELNLIKEGAHYGHPYVVGDDDGGGKFTKPLLIGPGSSFTGIAYSVSSSLPPEYRGCLYLADFGKNQVLRVILTQEGESYTAKAVPFLRVPAPVGIAVTRSGIFYICSYEGVVLRVKPNAKSG